jgi:hydrogenase maturation protease
MITRVIGVGRADRGDDTAGLLVADHVARRAPPGIAVTWWQGTPVQLLTFWAPDDRVVIVDALHDRAPPGAVRRFDATASRLPGRHGGGSHDASIVDAIELARALGRLPRSLVVYGITGRCFDFDSAVTPAVLAAADRVAGAILAEVREDTPPATTGRRG